jgi:hypothetical protein
MTKMKGTIGRPPLFLSHSTSGITHLQILSPALHKGTGMSILQDAGPGQAGFPADPYTG